MTLLVRDTGALRMASEARVCMADGLRSVDKIMFRTGDGLRQFYQRGIRPAATPDALDATSNPRRVTYTPSVSVSVTGGTQPYTHSWAASPLTPTASSSGTTAFAVPRNFEGFIEAVDTVTDANGIRATVTVTINILLGSDGGVLA